MTAESGSGRTDELKRALLAIRDLRRRVHELEERSREPIAIVGAACRLPGGADTPELFWQLLRDGVDATTEVPKDRWDADAIYDPDPNATSGSYVRRGGFLRGPVDRFDAGFFGISPREAASMDPMHRLLLEMAWEALERAGIAPHTLENSLTGVFTGLSVSDYDVLQKNSGLETIHSYRGTGTIASVAGGRISHFLGLQGPNFPVDTACSSGLVATTLAVEQLRSGRCNLALVGSVGLMLSPDATMFLCRMRALSPDGRCHTFDAAASGYSRGEGGGMLVLKRLSDALADGDPVLAVIRGAAVNHDGRSSGLTVPNPIAQRRVIEAALSDAGVAPSYVSYIEAHGTATQLGDPIELRALSEVLCRDRAADQPLFLGSVKTNLGHLEAAAGITGMLKVVGALAHGELPPHLHFAKPTPHIDWARLPFRVPTTLTPWTTGGGVRAAGVSAFGFSGTNAHVIVEEAPVVERLQRPARPVQLIAVSGRSRKAVRDLASRYAEWLDAATSASALEDLARTTTEGRDHQAFRAAVVGTTRADIVAGLRALGRAEDDAIGQMRGAGPSSLAFLFTGQGAQSPAMARELWETAPAFRAALERCAAILEPHLDRPLLPLLLDADQAAALDQTQYTQPALFAFEFALTELWRDWGIEPTHVVGHSLGEYVAATVAGVLRLEDALPLVAVRARLMQNAPGQGRMVAIAASAAVVEPALAGIAGVAVAAYNAPENVVVSGTREGVTTVLQRLEARGVRCTELKVSHAFHSPLMEPMLAPFAEALSKVDFREPRIPLISNLTGLPMTAAEARDAARWSRHVREPVRFAESIDKLLALGVRSFVEIGPHPTLVGLGMESRAAAGAHWLASVRRSRPAWQQLGETLGSLYRIGYGPDWRSWNRDFAGRRVAAPTYPFQRERYWFTDLVAAGAKPTPGTRLAADAGAHPLLGAKFASPALAGWVFQRSLTPADPSFLADHRVGDNVVVPGAAFVEMLLAALAEGPGWPDVDLANVTFERPLLLGDDAVTCQVIVAPPQEGRAQVQVVSLQTGGDGTQSWQTHVSASASRATAASAAASLTARRATVTHPASVDELYARIGARGIDYGPAFRTLVECTTGEGAAIGHATLRDAADRGGYKLHPCLLDAGFQLLASVATEVTDPAATFLPAGVDAIRVVRPLGADCWIHGVVRPQDDANLFLADLTFFSAEGELCAELQGYRARRVAGRIAPAPRQDPVYVLEWRPVDPPRMPSSTAGNWLLLEDGAPFAEQVAQALETAGARCVRLQRGAAWRQDGDKWTMAADDWSRVDAAKPQGGWDGVVVCTCVTPSGGQDVLGVDLERRLAERCGDVVELLRRSAPKRLRVVTRGANGPSGPTPAAWEAGIGLWGLLPVVQAEYPQVDCRLLDIDPDLAVLDAAQLALLVLGEGRDDRLALRGRELLAVRLVAATAAPASPATPVPDGENYRGTITARGTLDALRYAPAVRVAPGPDDVEIRVRATGLNFRDVLNVLGMYPGDPGLPGVEVAGTVVRVGKNVGHLAVGDQAFGLATGAFAGYVTVPAAGIARVPAALSAEQAATVPLAFLTAEWGLTRLAGMKRGDRVLVHAAAGGVGQAAVQLALAVGAEVFATAGSDEKRAVLRAQGVRHIFDSRSASFADAVLEATGGQGVDIVLNSLTGAMLKRSLELLRPGGRFLELGKAELLDPAALAKSHPGIAYYSFDLGGVLYERPADFRALFSSVTARFAAGELQPLRLRTYPAESIADAFRFMAQARHIGKVVIASRPRLRGGDAPPIRRDGAYLVTGATGGVGRALVAWLVRCGAGAVVVNSRTAPTGDAAKWLDDLGAGATRVEVVSGDVGLIADARRIVAAAGVALPLRGVFHAAGVLDDGILSEQTLERFVRVLRPKATGAWNLHQATLGLELEHFVLFGSIAGVMGGPGQGNYAAANAFLAALARHRRRNGYAATAIEWGAWGGEGMAARLGDRERSALQARGFGFLDAERALSVLERLLDADAASYVVADIDWRRLQSSLRATPPLLDELLTEPRAAKGAETQSIAVPDRGELAAAAPEERLARLAAYTQAALSAVLGARPGQLETDTEVAQYGFDSLMAMEFRNRVEKDIGVVVPVSKLLGSATVIELAKELASAVQTDLAPVPRAQPGWTEGEI
jgi:acyl transferase domain-containing protein/NADP-dependent 3-hydroxy acid dehydrogenase YdfG/acyl carrier protein